MPIPDPGIRRPSILMFGEKPATKQQRQEALAAAYGVPMAEISATEAEQMRQILQRYDSQHKPIQIHDLNNPPKQPYRFQKFPMMVYDLANSAPAHDEDQLDRFGNITGTTHIAAKIRTLVVNSEEQLSAALSDGWSQDPPPFREEREEPLSQAYQNEADRKQAEIDEAKRRRKHAVSQ